MIRTRFAPSPTGYMHLGGMRTALFNWLFARHHGGKFILRVDDTDRARNVGAALAPILDAFRWLGLDWDEGPEVGGPHAPYFQSERGDRYAAAIAQLVDAGHAYRDYDTPETVQADRTAAEQAGKPYLNVRRSLDLSPVDLAAKRETDAKHVVRLLVPRDRTVTIDDAVRGTVEWDAGLIPDPVLARGDGSPLYNLASVVDDADLDITHVIRAEEHLSNVPVQCLLFDALGHDRPTFAHIPFVTAPGTNRKLSKRDLAKYRGNPQFKKLFQTAEERLPLLGLELGEELNPVMVQFYRELGYLPEGLLNALCRLGWSLDDHTEVMSLETVREHFTLDRIVKNPAGFDTDKLYNFQSHWMQERPRADKVEGCLADLIRAGLVKNSDDETRAYVGRIVDALGDRLKLYSDILDVAFLFRDGVEYDAKAFKKRVRKDGVPGLLTAFRTDRLEPLSDAEWTTERLETELQSFAEDRGVGAGTLIHALRIATTGVPVGPGVYDCLALVGRERSLERIDAAVAAASSS